MMDVTAAGEQRGPAPRTAGEVTTVALAVAASAMGPPAAAPTAAVPSCSPLAPTTDAPCHQRTAWCEQEGRHVGQRRWGTVGLPTQHHGGRWWLLTRTLQGRWGPGNNTYVGEGGPVVRNRR